MRVQFQQEVNAGVNVERISHGGPLQVGRNPPRTQRRHGTGGRGGVPALRAPHATADATGLGLAGGAHRRRSVLLDRLFRRRLQRSLGSRLIRGITRRRLDQGGGGGGRGRSGGRWNEFGDVGSESGRRLLTGCYFRAVAEVVHTAGKKGVVDRMKYFPPSTHLSFISSEIAFYLTLLMSYLYQH